MMNAPDPIAPAHGIAHSGRGGGPVTAATLPTKVEARTPLLYVVEGECFWGDLEGWAVAQEQAHYSGFTVSPELWSFLVVDGKPTFVEHLPTLVESYRFDDYATAVYELGEQRARVRIDLRA